MKKKILLVLVLVLAICGSAGAYYSLKRTNKDNSAQVSTTAGANTKPIAAEPETRPTSKPEKACDILTQDIADKVVGKPTKADASNADAPKDVDHLVISSCTFKSVDGTSTTTLLWRAAKDTEGSAHDKEQFGPNKPLNAESVTGYGDTAYWDADFKQLNILKGPNWYILTAGPTEPANRNLDQAKQFADLIKPKL